MPAGRSKVCCSIAFDLLRKTDGAIGLLRHQILQQPPPVFLIHARHIVPVEIKHVEGTKDRADGGFFSAAAAERVLQAIEVRSAYLVEDYSLPI